MKRSGWRSAKTDASCGEKTSANEKVPSQRLRGTFKNCQGLILAESVSPKNSAFMRDFCHPQSLPAIPPANTNRYRVDQGAQ